MQFRSLSHKHLRNRTMAKDVGMQCPDCANIMICGGNHSVDDNEDFFLLTNFSCSTCDCFVLVYSSDTNNTKTKKGVKMDLTNNEEYQKWSKEFDKKLEKLQARIIKLEESLHEDPEKELKLWHLWNNKKTAEK